MTAVSQMSEGDLELERRRIREEHDRAWREYRRALSSTVHMHRFVHDGEMKDMLEKLDHARRLRRREEEIEEGLRRRRRKIGSSRGCFGAKEGWSWPPLHSI